MQAGREEGEARVSGWCYAFFAYDIGRSVDVERAARLVRDAAERRVMRGKRRAPEWLEYEPAPLRVTRAAASFEVGRWETEAAVECTVYDFGGVSVAYRIPFDGALDEAPELSAEAAISPPLLADSRRRVEELLEQVWGAVTKPGIADTVEDYAVFALTRWEGGAEGMAERWPQTLTRLLQGERGPVSAQQVRESLSSALSFGPDDLTLVDWDAAVVFDSEPFEALSVLEHANVELLEMRLLDGSLDALLEQSYAMLSRQTRPHWWPMGPGAHELRRLAEAQMDGVLLFEGVNNAIKLVGDQYLARLYRLTAVRLHLPAWDAAALRKIATAESIYDKISSFQANRRMEVLEWIIVILISIEIVWALGAALLG